MFQFALSFILICNPLPQAISTLAPMPLSPRMFPHRVWVTRNGNTALDMGDSASAQAIRQARDLRAQAAHLQASAAPKAPKAKPKGAPNLLALANVGRGRKGGKGGTRR